MTFKIPTALDAADAAKQMLTVSVVVPSVISAVALSAITLNPALCLIAVAVNSYLTLLWSKVVSK